MIIAAIEVVWNIYPARAWSSSLLLGCHILIYIGLATKTSFPQMRNRTPKQKTK